MSSTVSASQPVLTIQHDPDNGSFFADVEGQRCEADYQLIDGIMWINHTGVPRALEGRGIAAQLVAAALAWARSQQLKVRPTCSYVVSYMRRHPETLDLLARR